MANIDERVRKLEQTFAKLTGGGVVLAVVILGFFGFATFYQIPRDVQQQIPMAVTNEIEKKYPNIKKELERRMSALANYERRAKVATERLEEFAVRYDYRIKSLETEIGMKRFHDFGYIKCGNTKTLTVPDGTVDEWVLFSVNPVISADQISNSGNSALYSIATTIIPQSNAKSWSVTFSVEVNRRTNTRNPKKKRTIKDCNWRNLKSTPKAQILAIRID